MPFYWLQVLLEYRIASGFVSCDELCDVVGVLLSPGLRLREIVGRDSATLDNPGGKMPVACGTKHAQTNKPQHDCTRDCGICECQW